jgi:hypothetical protein
LDNQAGHRFKGYKQPWKNIFLREIVSSPDDYPTAILEMISMRQFLLGMIGLFMAGPPAFAIDYEKLERKLVKEPAYKSNKVRYALLLFGPKARLQVWAVQDGEEFYLDRDGNGDLTGKDKKFSRTRDCKDITLTDPDGKTTYVITGTAAYDEKKPRQRASLMVSVAIKGPVNYRQYCDVELTHSPKKARVAHFHGPLTAQSLTLNWELPPGLALRLGDEANDVRMIVGTMNKKAGCWTVVRTHEGEKSAFPKGIYPCVEIEWPAAKRGASAIKEKVTLKLAC